MTVTADQLAAMLTTPPRVDFDQTGRCRACPLPLTITLVDRADGTGLHVGCTDPAPIPAALVAPAVDTGRPTERPLTVFTAPAGPPAAHPLKAELVGVIQWAAGDAPRSRQTALGPSELGVDCLRRLAYRFTAIAPAVNTTADPWFSVIGTAVHDWLSVATINYNAKVLDRIHYLAEERVTASNGRFAVTGSCDLYRDGTVVDYKIMGATSLKKIVAGGPSNQYRIQVHTYGLGHEQAGRPVREVALACLPRNGYLTDAHIWAEPFDRSVALAALDRAESVRTLAAVLPPALIPATPDPAACTWCPWFRAGGPADATGCPGPLTTASTP